MGKDEIFSKYDADGDGFLNREEVVAYAKGEFKFELSKENLERIINFMELPGEPGIELPYFQLLKTAVGVARDEAKSKAKRAARQEAQRKHQEEQAKRLEVVS